MKKGIFLVVTGLLIGSLGFADDAKVMPGRVGRVYVAPTYAFADGAYDKDGEYNSYGSGGGAMKAFNLGFALEYGIIDWITAAVQWAPGWNIWSEVDRNLTALGSKSEVNANGLADIFAGAKIQLLGEKAPFSTSLVRLALAPGVKIPLPGPDYDKQAENLKSGDAVTLANIDKHVLGLGIRAYFDYIINQYFFVNLYSEFIYYPVKGDLKDTPEYGIIKSLIEGMVPGGSSLLPTVDVDYGYDLTFELEPVFTMPLAQGVSFSAGLPVNYKMTPGRKYDYSLPPALAGFASNVDGFLIEESTSFLSLKPNLSVFLTSLPLPTELKVQYAVPLWGQNERATNSLTLQVKLYFKI